jgi:hypothetical protein
LLDGDKLPEMVDQVLLCKRVRDVITAAEGFEMAAI